MNKYLLILICIYILLVSCVDDKSTILDPMDLIEFEEDFKVNSSVSKETQNTSVDKTSKPVTSADGRNEDSKSKGDSMVVENEDSSVTSNENIENSSSKIKSTWQDVNKGANQLESRILANVSEKVDSIRGPLRSSTKQEELEAIQIDDTLGAKGTIKRPEVSLPVPTNAVNQQFNGSNTVYDVTDNSNALWDIQGAVTNDSLTPTPTSTKINLTDGKKTTTSNLLQISTVIDKEEDFTDLMEYVNKMSDPFEMRLASNKRSFKTYKNHTILVELKNNSDRAIPASLDFNFPESWKVISVNELGVLQPQTKKMALVSFFIPSQYEAGSVTPTISLIAGSVNLKTLKLAFTVEKNYEMELIPISSPQQLQAGELITARFGLKNNGNVEQRVELSSRNTIKGERNVLIPMDSTYIVEIEQKTDSNAKILRRIGVYLEARTEESGAILYGSQNVEVIPTKTVQKDPYFRYPMSASLYFNSYTNSNTHYSTISAELKGRGYLDTLRNHFLEFIIRAPKKENLRRFSTVDQYSFIYNYKENTTLYLGDHSYYINRLGYGTRYGMGFKLDQRVKKWTFSAFFVKPRLYNYANKPLYGLRAEYNVNDAAQVGLTLEHSQGNVFAFRNQISQNDKGEIATLDYNFKRNKTTFEGELSTSYNGEAVGYAGNFNFSQGIRNLRLNSNLLYADSKYQGNISNSLQINNNINYNPKSFNFGIGHSISKIQRRLNPEFFETEPFFESLYATAGYRFSNKHHINFRFDKRTREDKLDPKQYHYEEYGFNYNFTYNNRSFNGSFGGRFAETKNLLVANSSFRKTYSNRLNVSYAILKNAFLRGGLNHIYTNRYGKLDESTNYFRYNVGINYRLRKNFSLNANYTSGFSPEETFEKRDYLNLNMKLRVKKKHTFEIRANYYENPGRLNMKEFFGFGKYTYSFGVGVQRVLRQGGILGKIVTNNSAINTKGIKIYVGGKTVVSDENGNFEFNNLNTGIHYLFIEDASLPFNVLSKIKNPIAVEIKQDEHVLIDITLVKAATLAGKLQLTNERLALETNLSSFIKVENDDFTYFLESNESGEFLLQNIVPGKYEISIIRFKNGGESYKYLPNIQVVLKEGEDRDFKIEITAKEKKLIFKNNNLKVSVQ
ncbi:hypothetical protein ATE92_0754 [Ulvibacter sp. MAR_2010_11]|uniref:hypothetical protein n=1 Tax=Ulvibacter sp. MAR_2010_11 TaxID=1250229 RepID=UPI000CAB8C41|nr:hypothetical protein [Ulvibacter sp. MAR_2010_11]PKA82620.1 hypothetical protein ATE92_0754 [Ulvibacter sp. MAR_2010_11]